MGGDREQKAVKGSSKFNRVAHEKSGDPNKSSDQPKHAKPLTTV